MNKPLRFDLLIAKWEPTLRAAFEASVYKMRADADLGKIVSMLQDGNIDGAIRAVGLDPVQFREFDRAITAAFEAGGAATAAGVPVTTDADGFRVKFQFNIRNPAAESWLAERSSTQVTEILDGQRAMIREYLQAGMAAGNNPRTVALDLVGRVGASGRREAGILGLTSSQEGWVRNYSAELASDNPATALQRTLRDKRFDRAVLKAQASGEPIPAELRGKMATAYKNRALRYRAENVARTEAMASLHEAQQQSMEQVVESGAVKREDVSFIWRITDDERTRDAHIPMDGQEVGFGEMFVDGDNNELEFPGDPNAPIETTASCRCWREVSVDFIAGIE